MQLYVLIQSADYSTDGYFQDTIKGIYEQEPDATSALNELSDDYSRENCCSIDVRWRIDTYDLITL